MGTYAVVTVAEGNRAGLETVYGIARSEAGRVEALLNPFAEDNELARLNAGAGATWVSVSGDTLAVLGESLRYAEASGGAFDPTVGPLVRLWGIHLSEPPPKVPDAERIAEALRQTGYRHIRLREGEAFLAQPGMRVDPGGIAKGYAVDLCYERMLRSGARNFMVNIGGNLRVHGLPRPGKTGRNRAAPRPWTVGVRNPFVPGGIVGTFRLDTGMAVATSGHYERFVHIEGRRFAHILDPRTGIPVEGMAGVTVASTNATQCDALSTALFVLGVEEALPALEAVDGSRALLIPDRQPLELHLSPGLEDIFEPLPEFADAVRHLAPGRGRQRSPAHF